ncbi:hypothetical protein A2U01_0047436, partial [Trifolium medium]|nr:hypothetical protein [Trifolium medium]
NRGGLSTRNCLDKLAAAIKWVGEVELGWVLQRKWDSWLWWSHKRVWWRMVGWFCEEYWKV